MKYKVYEVQCSTQSFLTRSCPGLWRPSRVWLSTCPPSPTWPSPWTDTESSSGPSPRRWQHWSPCLDTTRLLQITNLGAMLIFLTISLVSCGLAFPIMYKTKLLSLEQMMVRVPVFNNFDINNIRKTMMLEDLIKILCRYLTLFDVWYGCENCQTLSSHVRCLHIPSPRSTEHRYSRYCSALRWDQVTSGTRCYKLNFDCALKYLLIEEQFLTVYINTHFTSTHMLLLKSNLLLKYYIHTTGIWECHHLRETSKQFLNKIPMIP